MMTLTQYKKVIKSLTRDELEAHLFEMFKSSKVFKDIESSCWSVESNDELMASLQKRLEKCPLPAKIDRKKVKKTE